MPFWSRHRSRKAPIIICGACSLLVAALYWLVFPPLYNAEYYTEDTLLRSGKPAPRDPRIIFIAIDNSSLKLDQLDPAVVEASPALQLMKQGWPWPREVYPLILDRLFDSGAKVVAMDMLFPTQREGDDAFRVALDKYRDRVVIGSNFLKSTQGDNASTTTYQIPTSDLIPDTSPQDDRIGYVNYWVDPDGIVRHATFRKARSSIFGDPPEQGENIYQSLPARALTKSGNGGLIPVADSVRFRYAGPIGTFEPHSVCDLFVPGSWSSPEFDNGKVFKDKIVILGPLGEFLHDYVKTPYIQYDLPGPEVHMNVINAVLNGAFLKDTPVSVRYALIFGAGLVTWLLCILVPAPLKRLGLLLLLCAAWIGLAFFLYDYMALCLFTFPPLVVLGSSGVFGLAWDFFQEQRDKARLRGKFERYMSKHVVKEIVDNPESYFNTKGGMRKPVAIFFSDLRGFTSMTEKMADEHALVAQLNEYFDVMVGPIHDTDGCLDKLIGDAIMAVWGNIQSRGPEEDVAAAVSSALKMRELLPVLNAKWENEGKGQYAMGMGINFGTVIVGDLGSKQQMNFTVIGDAVNLASRIEGTTKDYHVDLLVGEDAAKLVKDKFLMQTAGLTQVKGRTKPVELFYVISKMPEKIEPWQQEYLRLYQEGIALYIKGSFVEAGDRFSRSLVIHPPDSLAKVYIERCSDLAKNPVPEGWNGVYVKTGK